MRLWGVADAPHGLRTLLPAGALPARGFVNGLAVARGGTLVLAALGQEPRLGRWARDREAHNGLLVARVPLRE